MREEQTEVLVVGAGPVGLITALALVEAGIQVRIIDREERTTARSYACALHPRALEVLERLGLAATLIELGRKIETVAFYDGPERQAEVKLAQTGRPFPFLLVLPQNVLEETLERRLREKAGVAVNWNHRFDGCEPEGETVVATVEELGGTSLGYIVPHWETVVEKRFPVRTRFLVGADGHHSMLRQRLGVEGTRLAEPEFFAAYEFESDTPVVGEMRVVLDETTTNVLWPLPGNRSRWTFQLLRAEVSAEFPEKERRSVHLEQKEVDERIRQYVQKVAQRRAPWFSAGVHQVTWCTEVVFEKRLVKQYGRERCWLAGDAAHQTGPVGAQSMNVGLCEAEALAHRIRDVLRGKAALASVQNYNQQWQNEWGRLLGAAGGPRPGKETSEWVRRRLSRIPACLPGSGEDLTYLAGQLGLEV